MHSKSPKEYVRESLLEPTGKQEAAGVLLNCKLK